jgi:hypothetical protein
MCDATPIFKRRGPDSPPPSDFCTKTSCIYSILKPEKWSTHVIRQSKRVDALDLTFAGTRAFLFWVAIPQSSN